MRSPNRFLTFVLGLGVVVLLAAILLGEHMGDHVLTEAADNGSASAPPMVTPVPQATDVPYSPDWKRTQVLAAATDPDFPDPRIPPKPLPTLPPPSSPTPSPTSTWTPNPNVPIWDQSAPPSSSPGVSAPSPDASASGSASPGPTATPTRHGKCKSGLLRLLQKAGVAHPC